MPRGGRTWVRVLTNTEKREVEGICRHFIDEKLKPRFLQEIRETEFNYPVDISGKWRGAKYSFMTLYRSGFSENLGEEFDRAFARLDLVEERHTALHFNVMWHRHTGQWFCRHADVPLEEALRLIETDSLLNPL